MPCNFTETFLGGQEQITCLLFTWFVNRLHLHLENAVDKVTLGFSFSFLAVLAKIGYLFTKEILFWVLLSICLEWFCASDSAYNMLKQCHIFDENLPQVSKYCAVYPASERSGGFSSPNYLLTRHITYCHLCIYLGTFNVDERYWKDSVRRRMRGGVLLAAGVLTFGGNEDWAGLCTDILMNM